MHLLIPFASALSENAAEVIRDLSLPSLLQLLRRLTEAERDEADEYSFSPPHERALARAWGWPVVDGRLPFAARAAAADGIDVAGRAWGLLMPAHWIVGREHVSLADPLALQLQADESRALFDAVRPLFESEGMAMAWGAPLRWYCAHEALAGLRCASADRVIGRNVDLWLRGEAQGAASTPAPQAAQAAPAPARSVQPHEGSQPDPSAQAARLMRRLQSEVQLTLYPHALNEAREARGALTVNSFWLSGCGRQAPVAGAAHSEPPQVHDELRAPLLREDWAAWADAWRALDAGPLRQALERLETHRDLVLTLCGERAAQRFEARPRSLVQRLQQRWAAPLPHDVLEPL